MPERKTYHVSPNHGEGWKVKAEGAGKESNVCDTKTEAVQRAKELAKAQPAGQIIIHKQDGKIQTEHTYKNDPYPPKG